MAGARIFLFGAIVTAGLIPLVLLLVPETPAYLVAVRPEAGAGEDQPVARRACASRPSRRCRRSRTGGAKPKITDILSKPHLRKVTLLLAFGYMFHTITFYYILKWSPQIVADFGYPPAQAATVLTWANVGGATGGALVRLPDDEVGHQMAHHRRCC